MSAIDTNSIERLIPVSQGNEARVSPEDYEKLAEYHWCLSPYGYVWRNRAAADGPGTNFILLHHEVLTPVEGKCIDHIDGDKFNNTRSNLRYATIKENSRNARKSKRNRSGFKGVSWHGHAKKWRATIGVDRKQIYLGHFDDPADAARAYDKAAIKHFGDFARLNYQT